MSGENVMQCTTVLFTTSQLLQRHTAGCSSGMVLSRLLSPIDQASPQGKPAALHLLQSFDSCWESSMTFYPRPQVKSDQPGLKSKLEEVESLLESTLDLRPIQWLSFLTLVLSLSSTLSILYSGALARRKPGFITLLFQNLRWLLLVFRIRSNTRLVQSFTWSGPAYVSSLQSQPSPSRLEW